MTSEDEYIFRKIMDSNKDISGKLSDVVILCLKREGYVLKLVKETDNILDENKPYTSLTKQIESKVSLGSLNSVLEDSTLEFKIKANRENVKDVLRTLNSALGNTQ